MKHILVAGTDRQNVRKAAELFSLTVGKAILYNFAEFTHVEESVIILNNGFNVLYSRIPVYGPVSYTHLDVYKRQFLCL